MSRLGRSQEDALSEPKTAVIGAVSLLVFSALLLASIFYSLPSNVVKDRAQPDTVRIASVAFMPQGWGFFTRPPSSESFVAIGEDGQLTDLMETPQNEWSNALGISRGQRAQGPELANLVNTIPEDLWSECDPGSTTSECFHSEAPHDPVEVLENTSPVPTLCGDITFAEVSPVDWSYRDFYEGALSAHSIVTVESECLYADD